MWFYEIWLNESAQLLTELKSTQPYILQMKIQGFGQKVQTPVQEPTTVRIRAVLEGGTMKPHPWLFPLNALSPPAP